MRGAGHGVEYLTIHGHRRAFVRAGHEIGTAPVLLLLHGLGADHTTWDPVIAQLARRYTVIAPDLLGHGQSAKPRADYTLGGYANGMRDLITVLGIDKVTLVGHSFGGGVAMQFAYQFPERTERLVLVGTGGLGPQVTPVIRAITTPGFAAFMGPLTLPGVRHVAAAAMRGLKRTGIKEFRDFDEVAAIYESFREPDARLAIAHVTRAVVDWRGQIVTMADRAYLTAAMPLCVIWGEDDRVIPVSHASIAAELAPGARVEIIANAGHFPHKDHPERFVRILNDFVRKSQPATYSRARFRNLLRNGRVPAGATEQPIEIATVTQIRSPAG
ncbi:alpha/beta fold hydrolase [Nocardioides agariphilus]|jgi:pimeloyl-ACP methyl ester carboxylesterase|uniref:Alpha/beta fold hydrolase n=1 Tax=Nocardioides agariphilus TaxID=433664 RepID=A0A930VN66_9ACTN|nr:alpha/beta fold hydrolase [Nocardioides agariphilus]MBF4766915.1 alpha/beta fold hydrolase [Nocardioides agariphilus]